MSTSKLRTNVVGVEVGKFVGVMVGVEEGRNVGVSVGWCVGDVRSNIFLFSNSQNTRVVLMSETCQLPNNEFDDEKFCEISLINT